MKSVATATATDIAPVCVCVCVLIHFHTDLLSEEKRSNFVWGYFVSREGNAAERKKERKNEKEERGEREREKDYYFSKCWQHKRHGCWGSLVGRSVGCCWCYCRCADQSPSQHKTPSSNTHTHTSLLSLSLSPLIRKNKLRNVGHAGFPSRPSLLFLFFGYATTQWTHDHL